MAIFFFLLKRDSAAPILFIGVYPDNKLGGYRVLDL